MSSVTLSLKEALDGSLDCRSLTPAKLCTQPLEKLAKLPLVHRGSKRLLADLFDINIEDGENSLRINNSTAQLRHLGAAMDGGRLIIDGNVGDYLGHDMRDGEIIVNGNAQKFAGSGQRAGLIHVRGSVGDFAGGAADGEMQGLKGGTLMVSGQCGDYLGYKMRRGIIIAHDNVANHCANNMIAGTIILGSKCGNQLGLGMRRGTVIFLDKLSSELPTFNLCGDFPLAFITVLRHHIHNTNHHIAMRLAKIKQVTRYCGDLGYDGQGEILVARY